MKITNPNKIWYKQIDRLHIGSTDGFLNQLEKMINVTWPRIYGEERENFEVYLTVEMKTSLFLLKTANHNIIWYKRVTYQSTRCVLESIRENDKFDLVTNLQSRKRDRNLLKD